MTTGVVPAASIAGMVFSLIVSFALPIGLFVYAKKKLGAKTAPFFIGCGVFFVMVLMLEAAIHRIVFQLAGEALTGSVILYAVYGGLMAALFEETGRYIAMRFLVKPMDFPNAFMYGAGHGGVEAMLLCGVASINNIASAVMINSGTMSAQLATLDAEKAADTAAALSALWTTPSLTFFAGGVERIIAVVLHLSLSILVFQSIRKKAPMELVRAYRFPHVNMDLIAGLPADTPEGFRRSLDKWLELGADDITIHTLALKKGSRILLEGLPIPTAEDVARMLDYADPTLRAAGFSPYYLYRQKYMSGSFENVGWCISGAQGLYNIYIMEELHSILSLGAGGSTKMVDPVRGRIQRVFHAKYPTEYIQRPEKIAENLSAFRAFHENMKK